MADRVGVQLAADDAAQYFSTLDRVNKVTNILIGTTGQLVDVLGLLEKEEDRAGKGAKGLGADAEQSSKKISLLEQATIGATRRLGEFAADGARMAAAAILDFAKDSISAAGDFEAGMNSFEAAAGSALSEGGQSLEQFSDLFIQMGRDLPVSTQEVQQAAVEMAKGGIEPATIAAGGLEQTLKFAAAAGLGLAEAAEIASKTVGGWTDVNATAEEKATFLAAATDLMAKAAGAASVNVDELALGLYNAQGKAKTAGVSFAETVTTLTALAPGFASSAEAGNSFKNFLSRLQPQTADAADAMAELGLLTEEGTSAFYDARGQFIGMEKAAGLLQGATEGLTQAEKSELLQRMLGNDAMGAGARLAELGAEGYRKLAGDIAKQNGVAEQAAKKQQGWNVAVDNLMGSLEALQITAATKALPALTGLVNLLAGGVNAITAYVDATMKGETVLSTIASVIGELAIPAIVGLTAVTTVYAFTTLPALTAGLGAAAAAAALAALPFVAIGAAVTVATLKFREYNEQVSSATDQLLETRSYWTESGAAVEHFGAQTGETAEKLKPLGDNVQFLRDRLHEQLEQLGKHEAAYATFGAASGYTREQLDAELASINQLTVGLDVATKAYNNQVVAVEAEQQAILNAQAASITATSVTNDLATSTDGLGNQAALTADDIAKLRDQIIDIKDKGAAALQSLGSTYSSFFSDVEQRQADHAAKIEELEKKKGDATTAEQKAAIDEQIKQANQAYADQEAAAAESYVRQQEEQRQHLGQMLLDYTVAQATLATTDEGRRDRLLEVARAVEKEYGLQESSTASTFLAMTRSIDTFSKDSSEDIDSLIGRLRDQETAAKNTQKVEDEYYRTSAATAATTFAEKGGDVQTYISELEKIPTEKATAIQLPNIDAREREIANIDQSLDRLPSEVLIHIRVKDDRPPDIIPHSPTAFELGIRGITEALAELNQTGIALPKLDSAVDQVTDSLSSLITKSDLPDDAEDLGDKIIAGWSEGMEKAFDDLLDQIDEMSEEAKEKMNDAWEVSSPSGITELLGENIMLGLLGGLEGMLPELLGAVDRIRGEMLIQISEIERQLAGKLDDTAREALERTRDHLLEQMDAVADTVSELPDLLNDALADAYGGLSDFFMQQSSNLRAIFDIGRDTGELDRLTRESRTIAEQLAEAEQRQADIAAGRITVSDEERAKTDKRVEELRAQQQQNQTDQAAARKKQADLQALAARTQQALQEAQAEAAAMDDPAKAAAYLRMRSEQILREAELDRMGIEATTDEERALIANQLILERQAHEAQLRAFELGQDQLSATQDLVDALGTLNDGLTGIGGLTEALADLGPLFVQLDLLLARLQGRAGGGTMDAMRPYIVGERGPELVIPHQASDILNALDTRRALAPPAMMGSSTTYGSTYITIPVDARGSNLSESQITRAVWAGINQATHAADVRVRMGVQ